MNVLTAGDCEAGEVAIPGGDSVTVVDHDGASVATEKVREGHCAICGCQYWLTDCGGNIHAGVECTFAVKWIDAFAERACDLAFNRPEVWGGIGAHPVGGRGILGQ